LCVITDVAGIARELVHAKNQLEHRCRRSTLIVDVRLATRHMWNGADKQAGIEVVAFSIVVPTKYEISWVGRIQFLLPWRCVIPSGMTATRDSRARTP
jgi:hypothetical protein